MNHALPETLFDYVMGHGFSDGIWGIADRFDGLASPKSAEEIQAAAQSHLQQEVDNAEIEGGRDALEAAKALLRQVKSKRAIERIRSAHLVAFFADRSEEGELTAWQTAVLERDLQALLALAKSPEAREAIDEGCGTKPPLRLAAEGAGDVPCMRVLIRAGADVDARDESGVTALMAAAKTGLVERVELLIKAGAAVDLTNNRGWTAMMFAACSLAELERATLLNITSPATRTGPMTRARTRSL